MIEVLEDILNKENIYVVIDGVRIEKINNGYLINQNSVLSYFPTIDRALGSIGRMTIDLTREMKILHKKYPQIFIFIQEKREKYIICLNSPSSSIISCFDNYDDFLEYLYGHLTIFE